MNAPLCCNKRTKWTVKRYGTRYTYSIEAGYTCETCGQTLIASHRLDRSDMFAMEAVREAGLEFDASLNCKPDEILPRLQEAFIRMRSKPN